MRRIRVLVADDHEQMLKDIRELLEPEFDVVGTVGDGQALLVAASILRPDVIVTDISMPHLNGIEASRLIIQTNSASRIILLTGTTTRRWLTRASPLARWVMSSK